MCAARGDEFRRLKRIGFLFALRQIALVLIRNPMCIDMIEKIRQALTPHFPIYSNFRCRPVEGYPFVEDEPDVAEMIRYNLEKESYRTIVAYSAAEALQAAEVHAPDLVRLDIMLPDLSGWDICRILRGSAKSHSIPILMLTGLGSISLNSSLKPWPEKFRWRAHQEQQALSRCLYKNRAPSAKPRLSL